MNQNKLEESQAFVASVAVVRHTIADKIIGVCTRSIQFLTSLVQRIDPSLSGMQQREVSGHHTVILTNLIEKLGDNLAKVRQASENALIALCNHSAFGNAVCISNIVSHGSKAPAAGPKNAKKTMNSNKLIIGRYQTLARILAEIPGIQQEHLHSSLDFAGQGLIHALQDVRQPAQKCIVELYKYLGDEVRRTFGGLRQAQIEQIESLLSEADGGGGNY